MKISLLSTCLLSSILFASPASAAPKKDECFEPIIEAMKSVAAINSKAIGMVSTPDLTFYEISQNGYFLKRSLVSAKDVKVDREYRVKISNGITSQLWTFEVYKGADMEHCLIRNIKSNAF